mgnify:CR=1 FL=1
MKKSTVDTTLSNCEKIEKAAARSIFGASRSSKKMTPDQKSNLMAFLFSGTETQSKTQEF